MNKLLSAAFAAATLFAGAGAAQAGTLYNADLAAPGVYFGSGNFNGQFTINNDDGIELALRAKQYQQNPPTPTGNLYTVALGAVISIDYSFNPFGADLSGLDSLISIRNLRTGSVAAFDPFLFLNATNPGAPGGMQNSQRLSFGFLNGASIFGDVDYNANVDTTYRVNWTVAGDNFASRTNSIYINQGAGGVPEPATWAMLIMGFGGAGAILRRRRAAAAFA